MALPKIDVPTYELAVPSTDEKIKYRPFLIKEEKILLIAMESGKNEDIIQAVKQIVSECTFNTLKLGDMPMFDVEYIFLQIRSKSVGEVSKLKILCKDDGKTYANVEVDLTEIEVQVNDDHTNKIELTDEMGVIMKYPTIDSFNTAGISDITAENMLDVIVACIDKIYDKKGEEVLSFGKYRDVTLLKIWNKNPGYFSWIQQADFPLFTKNIMKNFATKMKLQKKFSS